jgi:phosphate transport system substrate-binding protein
VEFAYALKNRLDYAKLQNRFGDFVQPTISSFQAAAKNADWENAPGFFMDLTDQSGKRSWPITGASYILIHKDQPDKEKAKAMLSFFTWCYERGQSMAKRQHYAPIPKKVYKMVEDLWKEEVTHEGEPVLE